MLTKLLKIIEKENGAVEIHHLCKELNTDRSAVEGMLITLRRMGYLKEDTIEKAPYLAKTHCGTCSYKGCSSCGKPLTDPLKFKKIL